MLQNGMFHGQVGEHGIRSQRGIDILVFRHMLDDVVQHVVCAEHEEAGVPQELAAVHEQLCKVLVWFLGERLDAVDALFLLDGFSHLYVAISCLGACGVYAHGDDTVVVLHRTKSVQ